MTKPLKAGKESDGGCACQNLPLLQVIRAKIISYFLLSQTPRHFLFFILGVPKQGCCI